MSDDVQGAFARALRRPELEVPVSLAKPDGRTPRRRFDVYRNNVAVSIIEVLRATFPAVLRLVGEDFFKATARAYLDEAPPTSPLLFLYGETFGDFLDRFPPAAKIPYLGDVARLEWARLRAYHAADRKPVSIDVLNGIPAEAVGRVVFSLHPSLTLISSAWPVVSLWAASTDQGASDDVDMDRAEHALVIRPALTVDTRLLPAGGFSFMMALNKGASLEEAVSIAASETGDVDLAVHLQGLFEVGAVTAIANNHQNAKE